MAVMKSAGCTPARPNVPLGGALLAIGPFLPLPSYSAVRSIIEDGSAALFATGLFALGTAVIGATVGPVVRALLMDPAAALRAE